MQVLAIINIIIIIFQCVIGENWLTFKVLSRGFYFVLVCAVSDLIASVVER